jgi:hypothetical protein
LLCFFFFSFQVNPEYTFRNFNECNLISNCH